MRCSIHIDAGYLYSALATRETGSANRAAIDVDEASLVKALVDIATADSGLRLLRVLWYDAAKDGVPDSHQRRIGLINSVKLRMGRINPYGEQKGVDLRLGLDLVSLGVNRAVEVAYLISGDDDITEAVVDAQDLGLQVKLITVPGNGDGRPIAVAANLSLAVDGVIAIPDAIIAQTVTRVVRHVTVIESGAPNTPPRPMPAAVTPASIAAEPIRRSPVIPRMIPAPAARTNPGTTLPSHTPVYTSTTGVESSTGDVGVIGHDLIEEVAQSVFDVWAATASAEELAALLVGKPNVPPQLDRILLADMVTRSGVYDIPTYARFGLRDAFWAAAAKS